MLQIELCDTVETRFGIQVVLFLLSLIAVQMVWREYRREGNSFMKFLTLSFAVLFFQTLFMMVVMGYSQITGTRLPELFMPMVDHIVKVIGFLLLAYAFVFVSKIDRSKATRLILINASLLSILTPLIWFLWYKYLHGVPGAQQKFGYFWGDIFYEVWTTGILITGLYLVIKSRVKMKRVFTLGFMIFISKQFLHLFNLVQSNNNIPSLLVVERFLPVLFFYVIINAIYHEIVDEIVDANAEKQRLNNELCKSTLQALVSALEVKDFYTKGHAKRVMEFSNLIGINLGLNQEELNDLNLGAMLHDIGKIGVHEDILNRKDKLNPEQFKPIRKHSIDGYNMISGLEKLRHISPAIKHHHERWDGNGYPEGLKGESIPLYARIIAVADAYDAMTTNRSYRKALSSDEAIKELVDGRGTQFDPRLVDLFVHCLEKEVVSLGRKEAAATTGRC